MEINQNYRNAFTEVYTILDYIEEEDYIKIPQNIIDMIENNKNDDYEYEMNEDIDIFKQPMLSETKAILFNFFRDYWATSEQKEKINRMQNEEKQKLDKEKLKKYNVNDIFKSNLPNSKMIKVDEDKEKSKSVLVVKKESIISKVIYIIKKLLK